MAQDLTDLHQPGARAVHLHCGAVTQPVRAPSLTPARWQAYRTTWLMPQRRSEQ